MRKLILLIVFTTSLIVSRADLGAPTIQAVCRISLINGETFEGFIVLGQGGYQGIWANGFYFEQGENYKNPVLFSLESKTIEKTDEKAYYVNNGIRQRMRFRNNQKFYYMQWERTPSINNPKEINIKSNDTATYLTINTKLEKKYKLQDTINLYLELPSSTHLSWSKNVRTISISVKDILKFEFLENPSDYWIAKIKEKTIKANEIYNSPDSSGDFWAALWYHEIIKDDKLYEEYQQLLMFNNKR